MAPRPSGGAKIWCHHRPLSRKRTVVVGKSNQSLLLSLPPTHYPNSSQSQKNPPSPRRPRPPAPGSSRPQKRHRDPRSRATQQACCREREEVKKRGILEGEGGRKFGEQPSARGENLERRASAQPKIWCHTPKKRPRKFILHGTCSVYSTRSSDRNRGFGRSQPISVRGREIERPASQFLSDRNRDFFRFVARDAARRFRRADRRGR